MKAISLWQPWASLVVGGVKTVETRSWALPVPKPSPPVVRQKFDAKTGLFNAVREGGRVEPVPLLIHAGKRWDLDLIKIAFEEDFVAGLLKCGYDFRYSAQTGNYYERKAKDAFQRKGPGRLAVRRVLPLGCVVGRAWVLGCVGTDNVIWDDTMKAHWRAPGDGTIRIHPCQKPFGNFAPGRQAWAIVKTEKLKTPIPFRGGQGLFDVPDELWERTLAGQA